MTADMNYLPQFRAEAASLPIFNMPYNKGSYTDIFARIGAVLSYAVSYMERLVAQNLADEATIEAVIRETERIYDIYIGPMDIPWVPNVVEPLIDAQLRAAIRPNLQAAAGYFRNRIKPTPTPAPEPTPAPAPAPVVGSPPQ